MSFNIESDEKEKQFYVIEEETGWFFITESMRSAEFLCDKLNELLNKPLDLHSDFTDWEERIERLDKNTRRLVAIDDEYQTESDKILAEARSIKNETGSDVIKEMYGANNDKVRKQYVDEQEHIVKLLQEKQELEFVKADDNRRISFLKKLIDMKINLIKYGVDE